MGVSLTDLITLAKAGYTPGQVKELIALSEQEKPTIPEEQQGAAAATSEPTTVSPEPIKATENAAQPEEPKKEEIDYKQLYERSQEDLKKAQAANINQNAAPANPIAPMQELKDIVASYY